MNIAVVIVVAAAAAIIGDNIGYAIGHMQGRQVARTLWPVRLDLRLTDRAETFLTGMVANSWPLPGFSITTPAEPDPGRDRGHALAEVSGTQHPWRCAVGVYLGGVSLM
jgi:hypothetical protein